MKPTRRAVFQLIAVTLAALFSLGGIAASQPDVPRNSKPAGIVKSYTFHDQADKMREITCRIDGKLLKKQIEEYGIPLDRSVFWRELNLRLKTLVARKVKNEGLSLYVDVRITNPPGNVWEPKIDIPYQFPSSLPPGLRGQIRRKIEGLNEWVNSLEPDEIESLLRQYYFERGFTLKERGTNGREDQLEIDYVSHAMRGSLLLEDCFRAIQSAAGPDPALQGFFLGSLFQNMEFAFPQDTDGLYIAQFWIPGEVMNRKVGDCDSKSVAFCSMWQYQSSPVLLVSASSPLQMNPHVLIGLSELSPQGDAAITMGRRKFVLYDIAGPAKPHPGVRLESRTYTGYQCIPPRGPKGADACPSGSWLEWLQGVL